MKYKAYVLRTCAADMTSRNGFQWPKRGHVVAPDWDPRPRRGNGLHGLLNGEGNGSLLNWSPDANWLVVGINEWVDLDGKVKYPEGWVVHCGDRKSATDRMLRLAPGRAVVGAVVTVGDRGTATAGDRGTATAGDGGTATAGDGGTASAGNWGTASAGNWGTATVGVGGTASAGNWGTATVGVGGTASAGDGGTIIIKYWYDGRYRTAVGYVGEDGIKPDTPYQFKDGQFVEAA